MARKVSPTLIGGFVVGALALAVGAVLILAGRHWFTRPVTCVMAFDSSVAGLSIGAPVQFRGVSLGRVSDIQLRYGRSQIVVVAEMEPSRIQGLNVESAPAGVAGVVQAAVAAGLRAQLELQSLVTGQLYVGLDFYPGTRATLTGTDPTQCEIPTIPTKLAELQDQMKKIMEELGQLPLKEALGAVARAGDAIEKLAASPEIPRVLRSADRTMEEARATIHTLGVKLDSAIGTLQVTLEQAQGTMDGVGRDARRLLQDVDARVGPLADSLGAAADSAQALMQDGRSTLHRLDAEIGPTMAAVREAAQATRDALHKAEVTLGHADGLLDGDSPTGYRLAEALEELARTARAIRGLGEDIERQPNLLLFGRGGTQGK
jgi:paraquat-inducible protein B